MECELPAAQCVLVHDGAQATQLQEAGEKCPLFTQAGPFTCGHCRKFCTNRRGLASHIKTHKDKYQRLVAFHRLDQKRPHSETNARAPVVVGLHAPLPQGSTLMKRLRTDGNVSHDLGTSDSRPSSGPLSPVSRLELLLQQREDHVDDMTPSHGSGTSDSRPSSRSWSPATASSPPEHRQARWIPLEVLLSMPIAKLNVSADHTVLTLHLSEPQARMMKPSVTFFGFQDYMQGLACTWDGNVQASYLQEPPGVIEVPQGWQHVAAIRLAEDGPLWKQLEVHITDKNGNFIHTQRAMEPVLIDLRAEAEAREEARAGEESENDPITTHVVLCQACFDELALLASDEKLLQQDEEGEPVPLPISEGLGGAVHHQASAPATQPETEVSPRSLAEELQEPFDELQVEHSSLVSKDVRLEEMLSELQAKLINWENREVSEEQHHALAIKVQRMYKILGERVASSSAGLIDQSLLFGGFLPREDEASLVHKVAYFLTTKDLSTREILDLHTTGLAPRGKGSEQEGARLVANLFPKLPIKAEELSKQLFAPNASEEIVEVAMASASKQWEAFEQWAESAKPEVPAKLDDTRSALAEAMEKMQEGIEDLSVAAEAAEKKKDPLLYSSKRGEAFNALTESLKAVGGVLKPLLDAEVDVTRPLQTFKACAAVVNVVKEKMVKQELGFARTLINIWCAGVVLLRRLVKSVLKVVRTEKLYEHKEGEVEVTTQSLKGDEVGEDVGKVDVEMEKEREVEKLAKDLEQSVTFERTRSPEKQRQRPLG